MTTSRPAAARWRQLAEAARKAGSPTLRLYATLNAYGLEVDAGDTAAIERLDGELRELQIFLTADGERGAPARAGAARRLGRSLRARLRAAGAERREAVRRGPHRPSLGRGRGVRRGGRQAQRERSRDPPGPRRAAADRLRPPARRCTREPISRSPKCCSPHDGRARSALAELRAIARRGGPRFAALVEAVRALHSRWTSGWHAESPSLPEALEQLERIELGGVARFFGALPLPSSDRARIGLLSEAEKTNPHRRRVRGDEQGDRRGLRPQPADDRRPHPLDLPKAGLQRPAAGRGARDARGIDRRAPSPRAFGRIDLF